MPACFATIGGTERRCDKAWFFNISCRSREICGITLVLIHSGFHKTHYLVFNQMALSFCSLVFCSSWVVVVFKKMLIGLVTETNIQPCTLHWLSRFWCWVDMPACFAAVGDTQRQKKLELFPKHLRRTAIEYLTLYWCGFVLDFIRNIWFLMSLMILVHVSLLSLLLIVE